MSDGQEKGSKAFDPMETFRGMRDAYLDAMAKTMVEAVNTEAYAQATGAMLEGTLAATAPFREAMEKSLANTLQQLSLPSRQEVAALAERFTNIEMRLDDMDAKLDRIEAILCGEEEGEPLGEGSEDAAASLAEGAVQSPAAAGGPQARRKAVRRRRMRQRSAGNTRK